MSVSNVDLTDLEAVRRAMVPGKTKLLMVESPTNPRMQVGMVRRAAAAPAVAVPVPVAARLGSSLQA